MNFKKIRTQAISLLLCFSMFFSLGTSGLAEEQTSPVMLNTEEATFAATVPTNLPIHVSSDNVVTVATNAEVVNKSTGPINIAAITVEPQNSWSIVEFSKDFSSTTVNTKEVGLKVMGQDVSSGTPVYESNIKAGEAALFSYDANIPVQTTDLNTSPAKIVLNLAWATSSDLLSSEGFYYILNDSKEATITGAENETENLEIPSYVTKKDTSAIQYRSITRYPVVGIAPNAFRNNEVIKNVTIASGVESIGTGAFDSCTNLETVDIPSSVSKIESMAFTNSSPSIVIAGRNSVDEIEADKNWKDQNTQTNIPETSTTPPVIDNTLKSISFNTDSITIAVGQAYKASIVKNPSNTTDTTIPVFSSEDESIATVTSEGIITAISTGTTTITATIGNLTANCTVVVTDVAGLYPTYSKLNVTEEINLKAVSLDINNIEIEEASAEGLLGNSLPFNGNVINVERINDSLLKVTAVGTGLAAITIDGKTTNIEVVSDLRDVELNFERLTLGQGENQQIVVNYIPDNTSSNKTVTYKSSNSTVASVSSSGLILGKNPGTTTITVNCNGIIKIINVTVSSEAMSEITLNKTSATINKGETLQLEASSNYDTIYNWESLDTSIATVSDGLVTAVGPGQTTIRASKGNLHADCVITVENHIASIDLGADITLNKGETHTIRATIEPQDTSDSKTITYVSSNNSVATVNSEGIITATGVGTAVITGTSSNSKTDTLTVTVNLMLADININSSDFSLEKGDSKTLAIIYTPADTTDNKTVTWKSSNSSIATINSSGIVTAIAPGTATITATVGNISKNITVTVTSKLISISIGSNFNLNKGNTKQLTVMYNPNDTTDSKAISYTSSNTSIATVSNTGLVTAKSVGEATITATVGEITSNVKVTVLSPMTGINLSETSVTMDITAEKQLTATFLPADTTDSKTLTWTSSSNGLAVSSSGLVTATSPGTYTVTATAPSGIKATATINVVNIPKSANYSLPTYYRYAPKNQDVTGYSNEYIACSNTSNSDTTRSCSLTSRALTELRKGNNVVSATWMNGTDLKQDGYREHQDYKCETYFGVNPTNETILNSGNGINGACQWQILVTPTIVQHWTYESDSASDFASSEPYDCNCDEYGNNCDTCYTSDTARCSANVTCDSDSEYCTASGGGNCSVDCFAGASYVDYTLTWSHAGWETVTESYTQKCAVSTPAKTFTKTEANTQLGTYEISNITSREEQQSCTASANSFSYKCNCDEYGNNCDMCYAYDRDSCTATVGTKSCTASCTASNGDYCEDSCSVTGTLYSFDYVLKNKSTGAIIESGHLVDQATSTLSDITLDTNGGASTLSTNKSYMKEDCSEPQDKLINGVCYQVNYVETLK